MLFRLACTVLGISYGISLFAANKPFLDPITIENLVRFTRQQKIKTVEELLPLLPQEFRSRYVLAFDSQSLQRPRTQYAKQEFPGTLYPRVIFYSEQAQFLLAFAGHESHGEFHSLEMIEYPDPKTGFQFGAIHFDPAGKETATFSGYNPQECRGCHRSQEMIPNWEPYNKWPGIYGSGVTGPLMESSEEANYKKFLQNSKKGRYQSLVNLQRKFGNGDGKVDNDPASDLTQQLGILNLRRLVTRYIQSKQYPRFKYAFVASLLQCQDQPQGYFPEKLPFSLPSYQKLLKDTPIQNPSFARPKFIATLRYFSPLMSIDLEEASMSRLTSYGFDMPQSWMDGAFVDLLRQTDPEWELLGLPANKGHHQIEGLFPDAPCQRLKEKSLAAFASE